MDLTTGTVRWEAQDNPEMPLNFSRSQKWLLLSLIGYITFMALFSSTVFVSGVEEIDLEFGNTNSILTSLTVSVFVLGFAVGPLFLSPLSEIYGRRPILAAGNAFFSLWQIGCALAPNINTLIAFRSLAGVGGSGCLSIGGGVIADLFPKEERGLASALFALGPLVRFPFTFETYFPASDQMALL
jgi:MFS family permease